MRMLMTGDSNFVMCDRNRWLALAAAVVVWSWQAGQGIGQDALDQVRQRGTLIWGADQEGGGPFVLPAPDDPNRWIGFEVELADLIAEHLGVKAQFAQGQWDKLPDLLTRGDLDIVLNGYEWTPARAASFGTSIPYYIYELQLLGRKDDAALKSWGDVAQPPDGRKKRIAVLGGSAAHEYLEQRFSDQVEIVIFDGATDAMRGVELQLDGLDANLQDLPVWTYFQNGFPALAPVDSPVGRGYYVALTRPGDRRLRAEINAAIIAGLRDGRLRKIFEKYQIWNKTQAQRALELGDDDSFVGEPVAATGAQLNAAPTETYESVRGWRVVAQRGGLLLSAAAMTVALAVTAMPLAILAGMILALVRLYGPRWLAWPSMAYVELIRGTPLVLQLYVIFFLLPEIGLSINAFWAGVLGLAMNYSAYEAEIYRAGIQAIPRGQMEAAVSLGMSRWLALRRIILPQATRLVIPPVTNDFIALFKDTAVCSVITVVELSKQYYIHARSTGAIVELGLLTALLYLAMSYPLSLLAGRLERRLKSERAT
jgi:polar amino acid transport system substrate-binding protein